jgi:CBS domain containing-hemolysin-like protein
MTITLFLLSVAAWSICLMAAIAARALVDFSRSELERRCRTEDRDTLLGEIIREHDRVALAAWSLEVVTAAFALLSGAAATFRTEYFQALQLPAALALEAFGISVLVLLLLVWVPRTVGQNWPEAFLLATWNVWRRVAWWLSPLVLLAEFFDRVLVRLVQGQLPPPEDDTFEEEIRTIVSEGHREGLLEEDAREMIEGVIELGSVQVSDIMTPRTDMVAVSVNATLREAAMQVVDEGHSRLPVYEKTRDDVVGVIYAKDLLEEVMRSQQEDREAIRRIMRPAVFIPESKPVRALLQEFQQSRNHMALVMDEFGGISGLVTIEDVLEEIVGEITDEHDDEAAEPIRRLNDHTAEVLGRTRVDEVNETLGIELDPEHGFDTIGGAIFAEFGHLPQKGESLTWNNVRVTVLDVSRRRVERVRIEILDEAEHEPA